MPFCPIDQTSECVHIVLQENLECSDWIFQPDGSNYVMKRVITAKSLICDEFFQSTGKKVANRLCYTSCHT